MTDKKAEKKTEKKSPKELEQVYYTRVERYVQNVDKWLEKLAKTSSSRKYNLGDDRKTFIMTHLDQKVDEAMQVIKGVKLSETKFKLP